MKYVLLIANSAEAVASWDGRPREELERIRAAELPEWEPVVQRLRELGRPMSGLELDLPSTARTVRVRDGEAVVTDGPYAETRELLGGYFLLECESLDEAIDLAAMIPVARRGAIEIRPLAGGEASP